MAKKKNSVALFEVISKSREKRERQEEVRVPDWVAGEAGGADPEAAAEPDARDVAPPPAAEYAPAIGDAEIAPAPRLELSLGYPACVAIVAGVLVLLAAAFLLGRHSAPAALPEGDDGQVSAGVGAGKAPAAPARVKGKYYLVIQQLPGKSAKDLADARKIARFCIDLREPVQIIAAARYYYVWSLRPFDSEQDTEAWAFAQKIERLGRKYHEKHGDYEFLQRKRRSGPLEPFLRKY